MKLLYIPLSFMSICFIQYKLYAQCTPNPLYADSAFGVWPDTIENFPPAEIGVYYATVLDFKFPTDGGDVDQQYSGMPIDSGVVSSVTGLPPGMTYTCNNVHCSWPGGQQGCALIDGTCNQLGSYDIVINIDGWTHLLNQPILVPMSFTGYRINVWPVGVDEQSQAIDAIDIAPNPFSGLTQLVFRLLAPVPVEIEVFDMIGNRVIHRKMNGRRGDNELPINASSLHAGIYFCRIKTQESNRTVRLVIESNR